MRMFLLKSQARRFFKSKSVANALISRQKPQLNIPPVERNETVGKDQRFFASLTMTLVQ